MSESTSGMERTLRSEGGGRTATAGDGLYATLIEEHAIISALIDELQRSEQGERFGRTELIHLLSEELIGHSEAEDAIFYGALEVHPDTAGLIQRFRRAHLEVEAALVELANLPSSDEDLFQQKLADLKELLERHVEEEESDLFARAQDIFSEDRAELLEGRYEELRRSERRARAAPTDPPTPAATRPASTGRAERQSHRPRRLRHQ